MKYFVFCLIVLAFLCLPNAVYAEGVSLKVQPANLSIRATPPADIYAPFTIENPGDEPIDLTIILKNIRDKGDASGEVVFSNPQLTSDADPFLLVPQILDDGHPIRTLTLGPQQKKELQLFVPSASSQALYDHYFSIVFLNQPQTVVGTDSSQEENTSFSTVSAGISIPVILSFEQSGEKHTLTNTFAAPLFIQEGPVPFSINVKNEGEHFVTVRGVVFIKNMFGQIVGRVDIPSTNILVQSTRSLTTPGNEKVIWKEKFLLGFYTATLTIASYPDKILYTDTSYFFAFPLIGLVILFIAGTFGISLLIRIKKKVAQE